MNDMTRGAQARMLLSRCGAAPPRAARTTPVVRTPATIPHDKDTPRAAWLDAAGVGSQLGLCHEWRFTLRQTHNGYNEALDLLRWLRATAAAPPGLNVPNIYKKDDGTLTNEGLMAFFFQEMATTIRTHYVGTFVAAFVRDMMEFRSLFVFPRGSAPADCMASWKTALDADPSGGAVPQVLREFWRRCSIVKPPEQHWLMLGQNLSSLDPREELLLPPLNPIAML